MEKDKPGQNDHEVLEAAMTAGHILLENGAEISRVEETMERICRHFGVESENFFVLSNGIFTTGSRPLPLYWELCRCLRYRSVFLRKSPAFTGDKEKTKDRMLSANICVMIMPEKDR